MQYEILGFKQNQIINLNLNIEDLIILEWFINHMKERSLQMVNDGKDSYFCTNYEIAMRELPAINFKKIDAIKKCFENLHKAEILVKKKIINDENLEYDYWTLNREKYQTISAVT